MKAKTATSADHELRERVEQVLDYEPQVTATKIGVAASEGVVTLSGTVDTYAELVAAEHAVRRTYGVMGVVNDLEVKPLFGKTDTEIAQHALHALSLRVDVPAKQIKVTVKQGRVTLEGTVGWKFQRDAAEAAVRYLQGVQQVINEIKIKPLVSTIEVREKIEAALKRSAEVDARRIKVEAHDGTVELHGNVRTWLEKEEAERATWAAPGVHAIRNHIHVVP